MTCLTSLIEPLCGTLTNGTCICENVGYIKEDLTECVLEACSIVDSLELELYEADLCGIKSDKSMLEEQLHLYYVFPALATIFVILRLLSRWLLNLGVREDDYMMIAALVAYLGGVAMGLEMASQGFGQHTWYLTSDQIDTAMKVDETL